MTLVIQEFKYARYTPFLYHKGKLTQSEELGSKKHG